MLQRSWGTNRKARWGLSDAKYSIIVFINKLDREGKDAFDLLDEVEQKLGFKVVPLSFPIGMGYDFQGIYNLWEKRLRLFNEGNKTQISDSIDFDNINDASLSDHIGEQAAGQLIEDIELVTEVYPSFDPSAYLNGEQQPVFFGSALNNFGVQELLNTFIEIAPPPMAKKSEERLVNPDEKNFSGFVFKIHANMDPKHRDRLHLSRLFLAILRNTPYLHVRLDKKLKFSSPNAFFADRKSCLHLISRWYCRDTCTGNFKIGDTLTSGEVLQFKGIPSFRWAL